VNLRLCPAREVCGCVGCHRFLRRATVSATRAQVNRQVLARAPAQQREQRADKQDDCDGYHGFDAGGLIHGKYSENAAAGGVKFAV
jgi:predicted Fe-S protein YdhL (DUF1289 family)